MKDKKKESQVLFADIAIKKIASEHTLPHKFRKLLKKLKLSKRVKDKNVGIKMHFGGGTGYTTIHPVFIRILVEELKEAGCASVKAMDNNPATGIPRGYTKEVLGCDVVSTFGSSKKYLYKEKIKYKNLESVEFGGEAVDCDFFLDLSHVKGHGDCGFGGALKNIAMGVVPGPSRRKLHQMEGGIVYNEKKCTFCGKCIKSCPNDAINADKEKKTIDIFFHHCTFCQHCIMICPEKAIVMENRRYEDFSEGMAKVTAAFLKKFEPENLLFINFLTNITVYCDCWGMSTPNLVPDIGILASDDIVAIETASLDMIKSENLLPGSLPPDRELIPEANHLFEKIHAKDPYLMVDYLRKVYGGNKKYRIKEIS